MSDPQISTLTVDLRPGESLTAAGITVEVVHKSGGFARLRVSAPRDVRIQKDDAKKRQSDKRAFVTSMV